MIHVEIDRTIDRPVADVFARLVDIEGYNRWMSRRGIFRSVTCDSDGPVRQGTRYTDRTSVGIVRGDISEFDAPRKVVFHYTSDLLGRRMIEGWPGYTLEADGPDRTRVHHFGNARLFGPWKLLQPVFQWMANRERRLTVESLQRSLEGNS